MDVIYFLLPISLCLAAFFLIAFIWSTRKGQFDDLETPAHRILLEEETPTEDNMKGKANDGNGRVFL